MEGDKKGTKDVEKQTQQKIRITITSRNVKNIERTSNELVSRAKEAQVENPGIEVKGPVRMPTKHLKMTIRKSPCGEGSKTWDRYELRIHKRIIDLVCSLTQLNSITNMKIDSGVDVQVVYKNNDDQE